MVGSAAGDILLGGRGNSNLTGGAGDDILTGGYGVDVMTGGAGHDVFRSQYLDIRDGFDQGLDRITDFTLDDTLDLSVRWGGRAFASTRDTADGTIVTLHAASHQHDVALLQGVHGLTVQDMFAHGALLV